MARFDIDRFDTAIFEINLPTATTFYPAAHMASLLEQNWNSANTDNVLPTIGIIYKAPRALDATNSDYVLVYPLTTTERKMGIGCNFMYRSDPVCVDIQTDNIRGMWTDMLWEACSQSGVDYCFYVKGNGFLTIDTLEFGDGSNADKDVYLRLGGASRAHAIIFSKGDVEINGEGYYQIGRESWGTGNINLSNTGQATIESMPGKAFPIGTLTKVGLDIENVILVGGSITDVTRNGQSTWGQRSHVLRPGDSITIAYSSAPIIQRYSLSTFG